MACRLAICPTRRSPVLAKATTDGVRRLPSALGITCGSPPMTTAMTELVVPRSMPTTLPILINSSLVSCSRRSQSGSRAVGQSGSRAVAGLRGCLDRLTARPRHLLLGDLNLDALRLRPLTLGHPDLQDPILIGRLRQITLDLTGQGQRADEGAVAQLAPDIVAAPLLMLRLGLALERECIVCHGDVDVLGIDAGQLRSDDDVAVGLKQLHRRLPCRQRLPARTGGEDVLKQFVHRLAQRREVVKWIPSDHAHGTRLLRTVRSTTHDTTSLDPRNSIRS